MHPNRSIKLTAKIAVEHNNCYSYICMQQKANVNNNIDYLFFSFGLYPLINVFILYLLTNVNFFHLKAERTVEKKQHLSKTEGRKLYLLISKPYIMPHPSL